MHYVLTILFLITLNSFFGQENEKTNNEITIETIRTSYEQLKDSEIDQESISLLLKRIEYGILLNEESKLKKDLKQLNTFEIDIDTLLLSIDLEKYSVSILQNAFKTLEKIEPKKLKRDNSTIFLKAIKAYIAKNLFYFDLYLKEASSLVNTINQEDQRDTTYLASIHADAHLKNGNYSKAEKVLLELYKFDKLRTQDFINLLESLHHQEKVMEIINLEAEIEKFNHPKAHYYFSVAYQIEDPNKSRNHLDKYARSFKFDKDNFTWLISESEEKQLVAPESLFFIGESFFEIEQKAACKYFKLAFINNKNAKKEDEIKGIIKNNPSENRINYLKNLLFEIESTKGNLEEKITEKLKGCE